MAAEPLENSQSGNVVGRILAVNMWYPFSRNCPPTSPKQFERTTESQGWERSRGRTGPRLGKGQKHPTGLGICLSCCPAGETKAPDHVVNSDVQCHPQCVNIQSQLDKVFFVQ